ncbi:hypothetical protein JQV19_04585 [Sulfitobacter mediterraneus]|uniref:hypothetical protein n=1 Tax=Sulfitobacter mediterraneus TaxID=83219 RepID=UPI00193A0E3C|nr:hypothetical protein [Sulfitobacter mediterraneus]MBM1555919.1 hypothetical protein [Sulfitobacter mediterraneus]MBM1568043.1 hypothetical protein [Sulfitobacter mediterraneus]MBM1571273.1 hypothetical protein [Sulfitobacter mediterraneus]MBM1575061.1 hypothetical protein [Sulfitobacter mediterraneus]MBM1579448.1 hypothetical protein [Sulfitobacter mediterraneus]
MVRVAIRSGEQLRWFSVSRNGRGAGAHLFLFCLFTAFSGTAVSAQQAEDQQTQTPAAGETVTLSPDGTGEQVLPIDCGDNTTTIERQIQKPLRMEAADPTKADWAEYERRVLEQFSQDGPAAKNAAPKEAETVTETTEGCALDEWDAERMAPGLDRENEIAVTFTGKVTSRTQQGEGTENRSEKAGGRNQEAGESLASAAKVSLMDSLEAFFDTALFRYGLVAVSGIVLVLLAKKLFQLALGFFFRRRICRIEALLLTNTQEFTGSILILGKLGCRFAADDFGKIDRLLDTPDFVDFTISIGGKVRPVFINRTHGAAFAAFFVDPLNRQEQAEMLKLSTIKPQFASWKPAKNGGRGGVKTVRARLARLQEMREEELARKATSSKAV